MNYDLTSKDHLTGQQYMYNPVIQIGQDSYTYTVFKNLSQPDFEKISDNGVVLLKLKQAVDDNNNLQKANAQNMLENVQQQQLNANIMQQNAQLKTNINQQNQLISQLMLEIATLKGGNK